MSKVTLDLAYPTDPAWAQYVLHDSERFDGFLADHANCERKASAMAMSFVARNPERTEIIPDLIALAREELEHFQQVYELMQRRGVPLAPDEKDPYVNALLALCRKGRSGASGRDATLLDRLLVASLIESRSAERFRLLHEALRDGDAEQRGLGVFYRTLWASESRHGNLFTVLALRCFAEDEVFGRLEVLVAEEAEIVAALPWRAAVH